MRIYLIQANVLGERVILFHGLSTRTGIDNWWDENIPRLEEKGFYNFDIDWYEED